jgi:hypothetical protein
MILYVQEPPNPNPTRHTVMPRVGQVRWMCSVQPAHYCFSFLHGLVSTPCASTHLMTHAQRNLTCADLQKNPLPINEETVQELPKEGINGPKGTGTPSTSNMRASQVPVGELIRQCCAVLTRPSKSLATMLTHAHVDAFVPCRSKLMAWTRKSHSTSAQHLSVLAATTFVHTCTGGTLRLPPRCVGRTFLQFRPASREHVCCQTVSV